MSDLEDTDQRQSQSQASDESSQLCENDVISDRIIAGPELSYLNVLNSESVFDFYHQDVCKAVCIKASIGFHDMTDEKLQELLLTFEGDKVGVDKEGESFGKAVLIEPEEEMFSLDEFNSESKPYKFSKGLLETNYVPILKRLNLEQWFHIGGPLPAVIPNYEGISSPHFIFSVAGAKVPLHRENWNLGAVNYVAKGEKKWLLIPPEKTVKVSSFLKSYLLEQECDVASVRECDHFLQHKNMYFDPEFLKEAFDAVEVTQRAGEVLFVFPGIFHQLENKETGMAIAWNSAPTYWCQVLIKDDCSCPDFATPIQDDVIDELKEQVTRVNRYFVSAMGLISCCEEGSRKITVLDHKYDLTIREQTRAADLKQLEEAGAISSGQDDGKENQSMSSMSSIDVSPGTARVLTKAQMKASIAEQITSPQVNSSHSISSNVIEPGSVQTATATLDQTVDLPPVIVANDVTNSSAALGISENVRKDFMERCIKEMTPMLVQNFNDICTKVEANTQSSANTVVNTRKRARSQKPATQKQRDNSGNEDSDSDVDVNKRFKCSRCGKGFKRGSNRNTHEKSCKGPGLIKCPDCDSSFIGNAGFVAHMKTHKK